MNRAYYLAVSGILIGAAVAFLSACGTEPLPVSPDAATIAATDGGVAIAGDAGPPRSVQEARIVHPRVLDLHTNVIKRSCSPNPGVCHNDSNSPDLRTPGALLAAVDAPCNVDIPEPTQGWDACERKADVVEFDDGYRSPIAWTERVGPGTWRFGLKTPLRVSDVARASFHTAAGEVILNPLPEWLVNGTRRPGETVLEVRVGTDDGFVAEIIDVSLRTVIGGDPNRNGTWGADSPPATHGRLVTAGSIEKSYLWGRLTATVPGSRMPLANQPLSNADYVALACWIEQMGRAPTTGVDALIDYDMCDYARAPLDPAATP